MCFPLLNYFIVHATRTCSKKDYRLITDTSKYIVFSGYNRGLTISHNTMFRLGDNRIVLVGESKLIDGSEGNQPRGTQILYNTVTENGIWGKQVGSLITNG